MYYLIYEAYHITPNLFKLYAETNIGEGGFGLIFGSMMMRFSVYTDRLEKVFLNSGFGSKTFFYSFSSRLTSFVLVLWFYLASLILPREKGWFENLI